MSSEKSEIKSMINQAFIEKNNKKKLDNRNSV